ncbi:MAG: hypothetical protein HYZ69_03605, partial [Candidatus Colwellbacteria bacterium]|nr:hypothetical protein [Candidatus Colwellbacteria bacterium]
HLAGKYRVWQFNNTHSNLSEEYIQDAYGGKTAEETHDLFLKAIKEEDIELASKYFVIEKQSDWLRILEEYERNNLLTGFIKELEETKNKGVFEKYPTGIWKISQL